MSKGWYRHHRLGLVIITKNKWWDVYGNEVEEWLKSEDILEYNTVKNRIFLYTEEQLTYFTLRWS